MARKIRHFIVDMTTRERLDVAGMADARAKAKARSVQTGHVVAIVAFDDAGEYPQGAYYGRSWRGGAYHYR